MNIKSMVLALSIVSMLCAKVLAAQPESTNGWIDVPLTDTNPFDINCEYRFSANVFGGKPLFLHATFIGTDMISSPYYSDSSTYSTYNIWAVSKGQVSNAYPTQLLQKRCAIPDATPSGAVVLFLKKSCPEGWSFLGETIVQTNSGKLPASLCKKD